MKASELSGKLLDYWVARALGDHQHTTPDMIGMYEFPAYSTDWAVGGPVIEQEEVTIYPFLYVDNRPTAWMATMGEFSDEPYVKRTGPTPLIAAMRVVAVSRFGSEFPDTEQQEPAP